MSTEEQFFYCLDDFEVKAKEIIKDEKILGQIFGGADSNQGIERNRDSLKNICLWPKVCAGLKVNDDRHQKTSLFGRDVNSPFGIAPTYGRTLVNKDGEIDALKAAANFKVPFTLTHLSQIQLEKIATALKELEEGKDCPLLFSTIVWENKEDNLEIIKRLEAAGFNGIILTLNQPVQGNRRADNVSPMKSSVMKYVGLPNIPKKVFKKYISGQLVDETVFDRNGQTWEEIKWYKNNTSLPIIVKGITRAQDAKKAIELGIDGIWISNEDGRQMGDCPSSIELLRKMSTELKNKKVTVCIDGGFTSGSDVLKALALGANFVFIGRPILSALAINGQDSVEKLFTILKRELQISMSLCGCSTVNEVDEDVLF